MGYSVVTSVLAAAVTYDLTDLATTKDELSLKTTDTSNDSWLRRAITQVSKSIARHTKRVFPPEQVSDAFDIQQDAYPYQTPGGFAQLELSRFPVLAVLSVVQTLSPANGTTAATTQTLVEGQDFNVDFETGRLLRLNPFTGVGTAWEAIPVTVIYTAGYGDLLSEAHSVPATPGPYTVTVSEAATFSCDHEVTYASGAALTRVASSPAQGQYSVVAGVYTFNAADQGQALTIQYATFAAPDDLVEIVLRLITGRFKAKDRDPSLIQQDTQGIGTQRWWFGGAPGQKGPFAPDIEAALDDYRMPVVA